MDCAAGSATGGGRQRQHVGLLFFQIGTAAAACHLLERPSVQFFLIFRNSLVQFLQGKELAVPQSCHNPRFGKVDGRTLPSSCPSACGHALKRLLYRSARPVPDNCGSESHRTGCWTAWLFCSCQGSAAVQRSPNCVLMYGFLPVSWYFAQYSSHSKVRITPGRANSRWMYG